MMTQIQAVAFALSGGGDEAFFYAPPSALDWCVSLQAGTHTLPDNVRTDLAPFLRRTANLEEEVYISSGSADNDAAMFLRGLCKTFDTQDEAQAHIQDNGWELAEDSYDGYLY